jgi:hypothetical protein
LLLQFVCLIFTLIKRARTLSLLMCSLSSIAVTSKKGKVDKNSLRFSENPAVAYNATQRKGGVLNVTVGQREAATDDDFRSVVEFKRMKDQRGGDSKPAAAGASKGGGQFAHLRSNFEK